MEQAGGPVARGAGRPASRLDGAELLARDRAHVWHPYAAAPGPGGGDLDPGAVAPTPVGPYPVVGARGTHLELADGRELLDGMSSWWAAIHGYNHPVLNAAVRRQLEEMAHVMFGGLTHPAAVDLAELLVAITPEPLTGVFLADSGSVAVEVAMKMAVQCWSGRGRPAKHRFLAVRGAYHGDTLGAMSVCDPVTGMHQLFAGALPEQIFGPLPEPRFGEIVDDAHLAGMAELLERHAEELAAVIIEPVVQGAGGMRFYAPEYLTRLRRLCDEHQVLLIADEIATGFGRTGQLFACEHAGVAPDILCVGKAMTGGYLSMAATLCTEEVARGVTASEAGALMHGPTFMGNPLAAAVSIASVQLLVDSPWQESVLAIERTLHHGLAPARQLPGVADVRVLGAIGVIEARAPVPARVQAYLVDHGVWLRPFGRLLYTMPPYVAQPDEVAVIASAMVGAAEQLS